MWTEITRPDYDRSGRIKQPDVWKLGFVLISHPVFPILCMPC